MNDSLRRILRVAVRVVGVLLVLGFFVGLWSMGGSHAYHRQALAYTEGAQNALIAHGLCQNRNDCVKRQMVFWSAGAVKVGPLEFGGVEISVYEVASPEVVGDLVKAVGEVYKKHKGPRLMMHVYESKHQQSKIRFASVEIE